MNQAHSHESALTKDFSIKQALSYGWEQLQEHTAVLITAVAVVGLTSLLLGATSELTGNALLSTLISIAAYILQSGLALGLIYIALEIYQGRAVVVSDLLTPFDERLWRYIAASILYGLMVAIGTVLFIIPGIWAALTFAFFAYPIIEEGMGPIEALKYSKEITTGAKWQLLLLFIAIWFLNFIGALLLGIGLLVTMPIAAMATVSVYYILKEATDGTTPPAEEQPVEAPPADEHEESSEQADESDHPDASEADTVEEEK